MQLSLCFALLGLFSALAVNPITVTEVVPLPPESINLMSVASTDKYWCSATRDREYWLSVPAMDKSKWALNQRNASFPFYWDCDESPSLLFATENTFFFYYINCPQYVFSSTDCLKWEAIDNPTIFKSHQHSQGILFGQNASLVLFGSGHDGLLCDQKFGNCKDLTGMLPYHDVSSPKPQAHWSAGLGQFVLFNTTHIMALSTSGLMTSYTPPAGVYPENKGYIDIIAQKKQHGSTIYLLSTCNEDCYDDKPTQVWTSAYMTSWKMAGTLTSSQLQFLDASKQSVLIGSESYYSRGPSYISMDDGNTWKKITDTNATYSLEDGPASVAHIGSDYLGVGFSTEDENNELFLMGGLGSTDWDSPVAKGTADFNPIVSVANNTMLWAATKVGSCGTILWASADGQHWKKVMKLKDLTIPQTTANAWEFPPGSGQVIALMHNCSGSSGSDNYGDLYYFPMCQMMGTCPRVPHPAVITPAMNDKKGLFHTVYNQGIGNTAVAFGVPYDGSGGCCGDVWYGMTTDGMNWKVTNINETVDSACKWTYARGLEMVGNGKAIVANAVESPALCVATDASVPSFKLADDNRRFGTVRSWGGFFFAATNAALRDLWWSNDGNEWHAVVRTPDQDDCSAAGGRDDYQSLGIWGYNSTYAVLFVHAEDSSTACAFQVTKSFSGNLDGVILPKLGSYNYPQVNAMGLLNLKDRVVAAADSSDSSGILLYTQMKGKM